MLRVFIICTLAKYYEIKVDQTEEDEMFGICNTHGDEKLIQKF